MARHHGRCPEGPALPQRPPARPLAKFHLHCGLAPGKHRSALFDRRSRRCRGVHGLSGAGALSATAPRAIRSSSTISPPTKSIMSACCFRLGGLACATCRLTAPISIPLSWLSPNSKRICVRRLPAPWRIFIHPWLLTRLVLRSTLSGLLSSCSICVYLNRKCSKSRISRGADMDNA